jgi:putative glycosyltransferase (TIGR04372 family)
MQFVLDQGGYVIRMGMVVSKPVGLKHPRLIDYPFSEFRSDFADIYLICHGKFVIGCGSGIVCLSSMVDMPLGCVNSVPISLGYGRKNLILIPKMIRCTVTNRYLGLREYQRLFSKMGANNIIVHMGIMKENNFVYVDNSPANILMITKAMYEKFVETRDGYEDPPWKDGEIWLEFIKKYPELV